MQNLTATLRIKRLKLAASSYGLLFTITHNRRFFDKKIKVGILMLSLLSLAASAQGQEKNDPKKKARSNDSTTTTNKDTTSNDEFIFCYAIETMPMYRGGIDSLLHFIESNTRYPKTEKEQKKEVTVYVQFTIDTLGRVINPRIVRGVDPDFDAEALRVICLMPPWAPGKMGGKLTEFPFTAPIKFRLKDNRK